MTIDQLYAIYKQYPSVQTDTRKLKPGDIFFALKGPNFNGNEFAKSALAAGAAYAVLDEDVDPADNRLLRVDDVLTALQELARYHRRQFNTPLIAITGTKPRTTPKH